MAICSNCLSVNDGGCLPEVIELYCSADIVLVGVPVNAVAFAMEEFTLSAGDITNGYITVTNALSNVENSIVQVALFGDLIPGEDYTWTLGNMRVTFAAHVKSRLIAGDQVFIRRLVSV